MREKKSKLADFSIAPFFAPIEKERKEKRNHCLHSVGGGRGKRSERVKSGSFFKEAVGALV